MVALEGVSGKTSPCQSSQQSPVQNVCNVWASTHMWIIFLDGCCDFHGDM